MKRLALVSLVTLTALFVYAQSDAPTVDETISALEGGITSIPLDAALANIEGWQATLEASDDTALQDLGAQLGELATALQADPIDGAEVGSLLTSLGEGTTAAAEGAGDDQLAQLGSLLTEAGGSLSGGTSDGVSGGASGGGM